MAPGLPARRVIVCAVLVTASISHAQPAPEPAAAPAPAAATPTTATTGRRTVAVVDLSTDPAAEALATELYSILTNHPDLQPVNYTFIRSLKGAFRDEEGPALDAARRAKQEAEDFLLRSEYRTAETAVDRGRQALHDVRPTPEILGLYAELEFAGGIAALRLRRPNDAALAFGLAFRLDPARRPDPMRYEPDIVEAFQLASTKQAVPAKLEVPGTGTVWIDGIDRGAAPGTFDLSEGLHLVQLSGPARETRGALVDVPKLTTAKIADAPASEERKVERARIELARARDATARAGAIKKLANLLGVGDVLLIEKASDGRMLVQTWRDRAPGFSAIVEHKDGRPADLLAPLAPPKKRKPPPEIIPDPPPPPPETPLIRQRWFQASLATGILAVAATIFIFATQDRMVPVDMNIQPGTPK